MAEFGISMSHSGQEETMKDKETGCNLKSNKATTNIGENGLVFCAWYIRPVLVCYNPRLKGKIRYRTSASGTVTQR